MSKENAEHFLKTLTVKADLRQSMEGAENPDDFAQRAAALGFEFTPEELKAVVASYSQGVSQRRHTGIWEWLRTVHWIERDSADS
ncbi:MAG: Nif11-like leader peptide family natural product precursor [Cyanobacteria bacterium]|nr:Nif11-like leader peptide family natural product precursor [Cyanobacteriota bacterium]